MSQVKSNGKIYIVRGLRMMEALVRAGFNVHFVEDDKNNPDFKVFGFIQTQELMDEVAKVSKELIRYRKNN